MCVTMLAAQVYQRAGRSKPRSDEILAEFAADTWLHFDLLTAGKGWDTRPGL